MWRSSAITNRPRTWEQVVGQSVPVRFLRNSVVAKRIAQCYVFYGPSGTGKTSLARIFSAAINCESSNAPCGACDICNSIQDSRSEYVVEQDAASDRGYEMVDGLKERLSVVLPEGKRQIVILDEVQQITSTGWGALLKVLEDPFVQVSFILVTTERHKLPDTILNRSMDVRFKALTEDEIGTALTKFFAEAGCVDCVAVAAGIARHVNGSLREALHAADQIVLFAEGGKLPEELLSSVLGIAGAEVYRVLANAILDRNPAGWLRDVRDLCDRGFSPDTLLRCLQRLVRDMCVAVATESDIPSFSGLDIQKLRPHVTLSGAELDRLENCVMECIDRRNGDPKIALELVYLKFLYGSGERHADV